VHQFLGAGGGVGCWIMEGGALWGSVVSMLLFVTIGNDALAMVQVGAVCMLLIVGMGHSCQRGVLHVHWHHCQSATWWMVNGTWSIVRVNRWLVAAVSLWEAVGLESCWVLGVCFTEGIIGGKS